MNELQHMIELAAKTRERAYAPYSGFKVGACLRTAGGKLFAACNVENVSYPQGQCAEASAIGSMVAAGEREIVEVVVVAVGDKLWSPCGGCRQRLSEFAGPDTPVHVCSPTAPIASFTMGELLPHAFDFDKDAS